ncbi:MAG TPA: hypothetical protein VGN97_12325 [Mesorhizobium sp.]|jgi:hypothetical protein|nr:hypothetical protein [Mesorhizobium sp.]
MLATLKWLVAASALVMPGAAFADVIHTRERPFEYTPSNEGNGFLAFHEGWGKRQFSYLFYRVNPDTGDIWVRLLLTNDSNRDGDTVCVGTFFLKSNGEPVFAFTERWGINADSRRDQTFTGHAAPEAWREATTVQYRWGECDKFDDRAIWSDMIKAAQTVCEVYTGSSACGYAGALANELNR